LLKGPSIARWLYPSGGRTYVDTDLLVPACEFSRAGAVLKSLGFTEEVEGLRPFEQSVRVEIGFARSDGFVDLHRNLPNLPTPDELLWETFSVGTETIGIGDVKVCVPGRTALALHVVIHAVQHGFQQHTSEDLRRAITVMSVDDWRPVADLATGLGIEGILGLGLRRHALGAEIADSLALPYLSPTDPWSWLLSAPRGSASLTAFSSAPTLRAKAQRIRSKLFPSPAWIRHVSRRPDAHGRTLLLAYARWWWDLAPALVSAVRFVRGRQRLTKNDGDG
jgi:hypothetical protein